LPGPKFTGVGVAVGEGVTVGTGVSVGESVMAGDWIGKVAVEPRPVSVCGAEVFSGREPPPHPERMKVRTKAEYICLFILFLIWDCLILKI
jgi:hypothetical protein